MATNPVGAESALANPLAFAVPPSLAPAAPLLRLLSRFDRRKVEAFAEISIAMLDLIDGDPDEEPEEDIGEEELGEQGTWGNAIDQHTLSAGCMAWHHDEAEDDDPSGQCDEDGINTAYELARDVGAGCPWSDPGEYEHP